MTNLHETGLLEFDLQSVLPDQLYNDSRYLFSNLVLLDSVEDKLAIHLYVLAHLVKYNRFCYRNLM